MGIKLRCLSCGYEWYPRLNKIPSKCPNCHTQIYGTDNYQEVRSRVLESIVKIIVVLVILFIVMSNPQILLLLIIIAIIYLYFKYKKNKDEK